MRPVRKGGTPHAQARAVIADGSMECIMGPNAHIVLPPLGPSGKQRSGTAEGPAAVEAAAMTAYQELQPRLNGHPGPELSIIGLEHDGHAPGASAPPIESAGQPGSTGAEGDEYAGQHCRRRRLGRPPRVSDGRARPPPPPLPAQTQSEQQGAPQGQWSRQQAPASAHLMHTTHGISSTHLPATHSDQGHTRLQHIVRPSPVVRGTARPSTEPGPPDAAGQQQPDPGRRSARAATAGPALQQPPEPPPHQTAADGQPQGPPASPPPPQPPHPAAVIAARHSLSRALADCRHPGHLLTLFRGALPPPASMPPDSGRDCEPAAPPPALDAGGRAVTTLGPGYDPLRARGTAGRAPLGTEPHSGAGMVTAAAAERSAGTHALSPSPPPPDVRPGTRPDVLLLDPVCISAAVCRMARLTGAARQATAGAAGVAGIPGMPGMPGASPYSATGWPGGATAGAHGVSAGWRHAGWAADEGSAEAAALAEQAQQRRRALLMQEFLRLATVAIRQTAEAARPSPPPPRPSHAPLPPRPFRPREVANIVWGLSCLRAEDAALCGGAADQALLLRLAGDLLPPPLLPPSPGGGGGGTGALVADGGNSNGSVASMVIESDGGPSVIAGVDAPGAHERKRQAVQSGSAAVVGPTGRSALTPRECSSGHSELQASDSGRSESESRTSGANGKSSSYECERIRPSSTSAGSTRCSSSGRNETGSSSERSRPRTSDSGNSSSSSVSGGLGAPGSGGAGRHQWRPGELAQLGWGMANAGVVPPSRTWLLSYLAAWDERTLAAAAPSELAVLAWALAAWHRRSAGTAAWRRKTWSLAGLAAASEAAGGARIGVWKHRREAAAAAQELRVRALLPQAWLEAFWAASQRHLLRTTAAAAAAAAAGAAPLGRHGASRADPHARSQSYRYGAPHTGADHHAASGPPAYGGGGSAAAAAPAASPGPLYGAGEVGMLVWSVAALKLLPPRDWTEAALRAAAALAPAAPPLALATTLLGAARLGRLAPVMPAACGATDAPCAGAAPASTADAAAAAGGVVTGSRAVAEEQAAVPPAASSNTKSCGDSDVPSGVPAGRVGQAPAFAPTTGRPTGPGPLGPPAALRAAVLPLPSPPPPTVPAPPPQRPLPPPPVPCQSLLAAFGRAYLRHCAGALGAFGPSQVVDLLAAIRALSDSGHLPSAAALPLPLPSLLNAAAARLQRTYTQGLGPRHLTAAAAALAALRHAPPDGWTDWWMGEVYEALRRRRLSVRELAGVLRCLTAFRRTPGPTWAAAALAAATAPRGPRAAGRGSPLHGAGQESDGSSPRRGSGRSGMRRASRDALLRLAEALAGAGIRLQVTWDKGGSAGVAGSRAEQSEASRANGRTAGTAGPAVAAGTALPPAGLAARRAWLRDFLWAWARGRSCPRAPEQTWQQQLRSSAGPGQAWRQQRRSGADGLLAGRHAHAWSRGGTSGGGGGRGLRLLRGCHAAPDPPTAEQAARLVAALTSLSGPPAAWPDTLRLALRLALRGRKLTRGLRHVLLDGAGGSRSSSGGGGAGAEGCGGGRRSGSRGGGGSSRGSGGGNAMAEEGGAQAGARRLRRVLLEGGAGGSGSGVRQESGGQAGAGRMRHAPKDRAGGTSGGAGVDGQGVSSQVISGSGDGRVEASVRRLRYGVGRKHEGSAEGGCEPLSVKARIHQGSAARNAGSIERTGGASR